MPALPSPFAAFFSRGHANWCSMRSSEAGAGASLAGITNVVLYRSCGVSCLTNARSVSHMLEASQCCGRSTEGFIFLDDLARLDTFSGRAGPPLARCEPRRKNPVPAELSSRMKDAAVAVGETVLRALSVSEPAARFNNDRWQCIRCAWRPRWNWPKPNFPRIQPAHIRRRCNEWLRSGSWVMQHGTSW